MDMVICNIEQSNLNTYQVATSATLAMELAQANWMDTPSRQPGVGQRAD
jgi:hypothetical protein